jgi:hypothetical protein
VTSQNTPKILSHILDITNDTLFNGTPTAWPRIPTSYPPVDDPYAVPYGQCPSPNRHETHATTSQPPRPPHVRLHHPCHRLPFSNSTLLPYPSRFTVLPTSTSLPHLCAIEPLQPCFARMRIGVMTLDEGGLPLPRPVASTHSQESLRMPGQYNAPPEEKQPTICAPVASCNVCHGGTNL